MRIELPKPDGISIHKGEGKNLVRRLLGLNPSEQELQAALETQRAELRQLKREQRATDRLSARENWLAYERDEFILDHAENLLTIASAAHLLDLEAEESNKLRRLFESKEKKFDAKSACDTALSLSQKAAICRGALQRTTNELSVRFGITGKEIGAKRKVHTREGSKEKRIQYPGIYDVLTYDDNGEYRVIIKPFYEDPQYPINKELEIKKGLELARIYLRIQPPRRP